MKLTILQEDLAKAITQASRFASTRSQLPILANILLSANKTKLNISSTNLEISVSIKVGAKIEEDGEISIPARVIYELVTNLSKNQVELETDKEQLKIVSGDFSSKVLGMNTSDFPKIPNSINKEKSVSILKKEIDESLPKIVFAAGTDETRPVITGVLFVLNPGVLTLVATDGFRLSKKIIPLKSELTAKIVVPKGILTEINKISADNESLLFEIGNIDKQIVFGTDDVTVTSRLIEGDYPDYEKIIPKSSVISVFVGKDEFLQSVKLASVFAKESANVVKLKLNRDSVTVFAESSTNGSQKTSMDAKINGMTTDTFEVAFNYKFLEDFLHSVSGEEVKIEFTTPDKAALFLDTKDSNYLHLIMPVRIQG